MTIAMSSDVARLRSTTSAGPVIPTVLAIVAGFVDSCSFLAFNGFFVAQATSSFVLVGAGCWAPASFTIIKVAAIPVFMATGMEPPYLSAIGVFNAVSQGTPGA